MQHSRADRRTPIALLALFAVAGCGAGSASDDPPPIGRQYSVDLQRGAMLSVFPWWPFGETTATGLVRLPTRPMTGTPPASGLAYLTWDDSSLGRIAPPGAPTSLNFSDSLGGSSYAIAGTGPVRGFAPPEVFTFAMRGRDTVQAIIGECCHRGEIQLTGIMRRDGTVRGEWVRVGTGGTVMARGPFVMRPLDAFPTGFLRRKKDR